jgi:hypothetical protein
MQDDAEPKRVHGRQPGADRDALRDAIAQEECLLAKLEVKQTESRHRLTVLRAELAALGTEPEIRVQLPVSREGPIPRTSADKVRFFRSLFRGRQDILSIGAQYGPGQNCMPIHSLADAFPGTPRHNPGTPNLYEPAS